MRRLAAMNTYIVVREEHSDRWLYVVKVLTPDGAPEPLAFYAEAHCAHADADRMSALTPEWFH
jgi:hypothetical protein